MKKTAAKSKQKRVKLQQAKGCRRPSSGSALRRLKRDMKRQQAMWRKTQNQPGEWCSYHSGVIWGLYLAECHIKGIDPIKSMGDRSRK